MALAGVALLIGKHSRHKAAHRIGHGHRRDLAAGEDKVAKRYLLIDALLDEALIHALIMPADEYKMIVIALEALCRLLRVGLALRGHVYHAAAHPLRLCLYRVKAALERLRHHHAAEAAAVGVVVHLILLVLGIVAYLHAVYFNYAFLRRAAYDALMKHRIDRRGEKRHYIYAHCLTFPR